jgi:hypothetical protein
MPTGLQERKWIAVIQDATLSRKSTFNSPERTVRKMNVRLSLNDIGKTILFSDGIYGLMLSEDSNYWVCAYRQKTVLVSVSGDVLGHDLKIDRIIEKGA